MWIEVLGLPGVGKTTLIEKSLNTISQHYEVVESRKTRVTQRVLARLYYHMYFSRYIHDKALAQKLAYRMSFRPLSLGRKNIFFYDSGLAQVFLENLIENNFESRSPTMALLKKLPLPKCLIIIEDDVEMVVNREVSRQPRRYDIDENELLQRYKIAQEWIEADFKPLFQQVHVVKPDDVKRFKDIIVDAQSH